MAGINWRNEKRRLSDLVKWDSNPRRSTREQRARIGESVETFGQVLPIIVGPDNEVYDGHQRIQTLTESLNDGQDIIVEVRVSDRPLTESERRELAIKLHTAKGAFDIDRIIGWNDDELIQDLASISDELSQELESIESLIPAEELPSIREVGEPKYERASVFFLPVAVTDVEFFERVIRETGGSNRRESVRIVFEHAERQLKNLDEDRDKAKGFESIDAADDMRDERGFISDLEASLLSSQNRSGN